MWMVLDSLTCPHTGTAFSCLYKGHCPKMFIWYESNISLCPGDTVMPVPAKGGIIVNGEFRKMTVYHTAIFRTEVWARLYKAVKCSEDPAASTANEATVLCEGHKKGRPQAALK